MSLHYIPKSAQDTLPKNVYMQVVYIIKDYNRMLKERNNILYGTAPHDWQPKSRGSSDTTGNKAVRLSALSSRVDSIDAVIHDTNAKYNKRIKRNDVECFDSLEAFNDYGYFCYVLYDPEKDRQPANITWKRYRASFARKIADSLHIV